MFNKDTSFIDIKVLVSLKTQFIKYFFDDIKLTFSNTEDDTSDGIIYDMTNEAIEQKIEQYLSVREEEKNKHGEVFTPPQLIDEMIVKIDISFFKDLDIIKLFQIMCLISHFLI